MKLHDKQGNVVMELISIHKENGGFMLKAKLMNALVANIYLHPEDLWNLKNFLSWSIILHLPVMIIKGFFRSKNVVKLRKWICNGNR
ncbi:MAG: hypothetical protein AB2L11_07770 [Syntrophobacteraceae bacterium]